MSVCDVLCVRVNMYVGIYVCVCVFFFLPSQYFQEFTDAVEVFRLVDESKEDVIDLLPDKGTQPQKLAVDAVENGLQEVTLAWILGVEQL